MVIERRIDQKVPVLRNLRACRSPGITVRSRILAVWHNDTRGRGSRSRPCLIPECAL